MPIYINESLSPGRRRLLNAAREKKSEKHYTYLWIRGGKILMRKAEGEPVKVVTSLADLDKLAGGTIVYVRDCYQCSGVSERDDIRSADVLQLDVRVSDLERLSQSTVSTLPCAPHSLMILRMY
ncbi:hypothetical protein J6590_054665 [Homalodisca vitripennis]|nr:hypothetical protein J6590_054665 [Homalodisca vitripennis]